MAKYRTCPRCGAHLDHGERCDCQEEKAETEELYRRLVKVSPGTGQLAFCLEGGRQSYV